jgi:hypothetical protein
LLEYKLIDEDLLDEMSKDEFIMTLKAFAEIGLGNEDLYKRMVFFCFKYYFNFKY